MSSIKEADLNFDPDKQIKVVKIDRSPAAKEAAVEKLFNYKITHLLNFKDFERSVYLLFALVFEGFYTRCLFDRCFEKYQIDDEFVIQPDFNCFNAHQLLWILDSVCHVNRRNKYLITNFLIKTRYLKNLVDALKQKQDHIFDEVDEDFFDRR